MILNPKLARSVLNAWIKDQQHPHRERDKREYPDEESFAEFVDIAFRASLLNEEGKPVLGSLILISPNDLKSYEIPKRRESPLILSLNEPRRLDVEVVAKLATITTAGSSSLMIEWREGSGYVWGIIYYVKHTGFFQEIPAFLPEGRHFSPDFPTIEIAGTGSLIVTRSGSVIGRIENGDFKKAVPTPFAYPAMGATIAKLFSNKYNDDTLSTEDDIQRERILFACLEYLLFEIDKQGGGATIIFIPDISISSAQEFAIYPWDNAGGLELDQIIQACISYGKTGVSGDSSYLFVLKAKEVLRQRLNAIAKLALLDGAVLLTPSFEPLGFGVKLKAPEILHQLQVGPDAYGNKRDDIDFSRLGTRHNSALSYVASVPGAVGFVASEDGPIRGLAMASSGVVNCWPDCRLSMFA